MNALKRLADSYDEQRAQLNGRWRWPKAKSRIIRPGWGRPFTHAAYLKELITLRARLKIALF